MKLHGSSSLPPSLASPGLVFTCTFVLVNPLDPSGVCECFIGVTMLLKVKQNEAFCSLGRIRSGRGRSERGSALAVVSKMPISALRSR